MHGFVSQGKTQGLTAKGFAGLGRATLLVACGAATVAGPFAARAQVFTVGSEKIESRYSDIRRTHVDLSSQPLLQRSRQELMRVLQAEQGFAMRPLPRGSKGMILEANGAATPNGADYVKSLQHNGTAFQPADRVAITDIKILQDKIVFELNGGPDHKHKILRHISVGVGGMEVPLARDDGQEPTGVRITLQFEKFIPEMTGTQVKELLAPLIDFQLKSPTQAYTDTMPPKLREAILNHHVLVGMSPEMVLHTLGHPDSKSRERDGDMPFEEWIYGEPPKDVEFVRFNGNRVIQVEEAKLGQSPIIRTADEMGDYWETAVKPNVHEVELGDAKTTSVSLQSAPAAPPSLRKPGENLPGDKDSQSMQPVQFPKTVEKKPAATAPASSSPTTPTPTNSPTPESPPLPSAAPAATGSSPSPTAHRAPPE